ncbi:hypothetical protein [Ralstonia sp. A12]|uniref:hypothetical protein n=1 Tax=Ralstonia sp. A12 TaxID=1217052 RepID=UPI000A7C8967|nr:hypothetical protein [Ralstonia sp. A12]
MTATQQYSGSGDGIGGFEGAADVCFSNPTAFGRQTKPGGWRQQHDATREE